MNAIDKFSKLIGQLVSWLVILMVIGTLYNVIARYYFQQYSIILGESVIIMNAMVFMLSAPLLLLLDQHVRVDVFYSQMSTRKQAIVDFFGTLFLLLPFCGFIISSSWLYVKNSWLQLEESGQTGGLPGLYLFKTLIIVLAVMMILQGLSLLIKKFNLIKNPHQAHTEHHHEELPL